IERKSPFSRRFDLPGNKRERLLGKFFLVIVLQEEPRLHLPLFSTSNANRNLFFRLQIEKLIFAGRFHLESGKPADPNVVEIDLAGKVRWISRFINACDAKMPHLRGRSEWTDLNQFPVSRVIDACRSNLLVDDVPYFVKELEHDECMIVDETFGLNLRSNDI